MMEQFWEKYGVIEKKYPKLITIFEGLFLLGVGSFLFCQMILTTTLPTSFLFGLAGMVMNLIQFAVIPKVLLELKYWKQLLMAFAFAILYYLVFRTIDSNLLIFYAWLAVGMVGVQYRKVLRLYVVVVGMLLLLAVLSSLLGNISNLIYLELEGFRDSFGICYPTDFAAYLLYLLLFFWVAWEKIPNWVTLLLTVPLLAIVVFLNHSDASMFGGIALALAVILCMIGERWKENALVVWGRKVFGILLPLAFPIFAVFFFLLLALFAMHTKIGTWMNDILTGRLFFTLKSLQENGIHMLGNSIPMKGRGFSTFPVDGYNFVDSSYPLILIKYGWLLFLVIMVLWVWSSFRAVRNDDYRLAFAMALIAFHSLAEHHFIEAYYNVLIVMPFAFYEKMPSKKGGESIWKTCVFALVSIGILVIFSPIWLSELRTVCGWMRIKGQGSLILVSICTLFSLVAFLCFWIAGFYFGIHFHVKKGKLGMILCFLIAAVLFIGCVAWTKGMLHKAGDDLKEMIAADEKAMKVIDGQKEAKVYVSHIPELYHRQYSSVRYHVFYEEDLARYDDCCVIVPRGSDRNIFFKRGFFYFPISEKTAVYTNEANLCKALGLQGFVGTDYFPEVRTLHNADVLDLVNGKYLIRIVMRVNAEEMGKDSVASIKIFGKGGKEILYQDEIDGEKADEDGLIEENVELVLKGDTAGVVFYLLPMGGADPNMEEFSIQMIP